MNPEANSRSSILSGAAFLMAVSAIGPGFLTQTTRFTVNMGASLGFAILVSILIDVGAQLNSWRVICISGRRGQEVADAIVPGLRWLLIGVIVAGSFIFNLGNLSGCALGLKTLLDLPEWLGAMLSAALAVGLFLLPQMMTGVDWVSKVLGAAMIGMTLWIVVATAPPLDVAVHRAVIPEQIDPRVIVTMVGGTIGGYIMFSGAHRLLDAGITGAEHAPEISRASIQGILIAGLMRVVVFLAVLGVVSSGTVLEGNLIVFDAFHSGAGETGRVLSGLVFWSAAITSVVGCSYTSISFLGPARSNRFRGFLIAGFIAASWLATFILQMAGWKETPLLIAAGEINGVLLPLILGVLLIAAHRKTVMGDYRHPWWTSLMGVLAWLGTLFCAAWTVWSWISAVGSWMSETSRG